MVFSGIHELLRSPIWDWCDKVSDLVVVPIIINNQQQMKYKYKGFHAKDRIPFITTVRPPFICRFTEILNIKSTYYVRFETAK